MLSPNVNLSQPDAAFGLLLASEKGASPTRLARLFDCSEREVSEVLEKARAGELERAPSCDGCSLTVRGDDACEGEVLCRRWQRRVCLHLVKHGQISSAQVLDIAPEGIASTTAIHALGVGLRPLRIFLRAFGGGWQIDDAQRDRLAAVIRAGWRKDAVKVVPETRQ